MQLKKSVPLLGLMLTGIFVVLITPAFAGSFQREHQEQARQRFLHGENAELKPLWDHFSRVTEPKQRNTVIKSVNNNPAYLRAATPSNPASRKKLYKPVNWQEKGFVPFTFRTRPGFSD